MITGESRHPVRCSSAPGRAGAVGAAQGVMLGVHEGWPVERCLEAGVRVAAVSLSDYSTSGTIRPIGECLAYGRRHGFREPARG